MKKKSEPIWKSCGNGVDCIVTNHFFFLKLAELKQEISGVQFESIHPFLDGNGRTGRIIIPLYLLNLGLLKKPCFYISDYFEIHRTEYYDALNRVRLNHDMIGWIVFFLKAAVETARSARVKFGKAVALVDEYNRLVRQIPGNAENVQAIFAAFYNHPIQNENLLAESNSISKQTVSRILSAMKEKGILDEITGYSRNRVYAMKNILMFFGFNICCR